MSLNRIRFEVIFPEIHKLIDLNPRDHKNREKIITKVKDALANTHFSHNAIMNLDEIFKDGFQLTDVPLLIKTLISLNVILDSSIKLHYLKYILYAVVIMYFNEDLDNFDDLRKLFDDVFDLLEVDPKKLINNKFFKC